MKKSLKVLAAIALMAGMVGCSSNDSKGDDSAEATANVGIIQYAEHPALDAATEGFVDYLEEQGYSIPDSNIKNAQGDQSNCVTIAETLVNDNVDLIYAVATPAAQAAANKTKDIPIIVSAVTDPAASGLVEDNEKPGGNVTGSSDMNPIEEQMDLLKQLLPDAKKIAIMYCNAEDNSKLQAEQATKAAEALGLKVEEATVTDSNQIQQVAESLVGKVDAIYVPTDNLLAEGMSALSQVANENNLPTIVGEEGMVDNGGLATYSVDYYELGQIAGSQAVAILKGEKEAKDTAIEYMPKDKLTLVINQSSADKLGITIPDDLKDKAEFVTE